MYMHASYSASYHTALHMLKRATCTAGGLAEEGGGRGWSSGGAWRSARERRSANDSRRAIATPATSRRLPLREAAFGNADLHAACERC